MSPKENSLWIRWKKGWYYEVSPPDSLSLTGSIPVRHMFDLSGVVDDYALIMLVSRFGYDDELEDEEVPHVQEEPSISK